MRSRRSRSRELAQSRGRAGAEQLGSTSRVALEGWAALHGVALQGVANSRGCEFKGLHLHCRGWPRTAVPTWLSPCTAAPRGAWRPCSPRSCSRRPLRCPATPRSCSRRPLRCPAAGHGERSRLYLLYQFGCSSRLTGVLYFRRCDAVSPESSNFKLTHLFAFQCGSVTF